MVQNVKVSHSYFMGKLRRLHQLTGLTLVLLLAGVINVQASTYSETVKFDLKMKKVSLKEVFQTITDQSDYKFIYNNDMVDDEQKVSVTSANATVKEILDGILPKQDLEYQVVNHQVIVFPAKGNYSVSNVEGKQIRTIAGTIIDEDGMPHSCVPAVALGTIIDVVTNIDGNYSLGGIPENSKVLKFSFVGMKCKAISIDNKSSTNIL